MCANDWFDEFNYIVCNEQSLFPSARNKVTSCVIRSGDVWFKGLMLSLLSIARKSETYFLIFCDNLLIPV